MAFYPSACWVMVAILVTSRFSGEPGDRSPDAREWVGRVLLWLIAAQAIVHHILVAVAVR